MLFPHVLLKSEGDPICAGIFLLIVGVGAMLNGVNKYLLLQKIKNTPTSKVRSAAVGLVELYGTALCSDELRSPISNEKCVYCILHAEYYKSGKHGGWRTIFRNVYSKKFYLQDETGKILVDPTGAEVSIPVDKVYDGYIGGVGIFGMPHKNMDPEVMKFIESTDPNTRRLLMNHSREHVRISEYYIAEGDKVYVLGTAEPLPGKASDVAHENLIVKKGANEGVLYITDTHESNVTMNLQSTVIWGLFGGLAAAAIGLFIIFWRIGIL